MAVSGEKCESILEHDMKIGSGASFRVTSQGTQSLLLGNWDHLNCDFSRISKNMGENLPLLTNPIPGGGARPMIFGLNRNQGGYLTYDFSKIS